MENRFTQEELKLLAEIAPINSWITYETPSNEYPNKRDIRYCLLGNHMLLVFHGKYTLKYMGTEKESYLHIPFEELPLFVNVEPETLRCIVNWRLKIEK